LQLETSSFCAKEENASRNTVETTDLLAQCQKATGTEEKNTLQERLYLPTLIVSVKAVSLSKCPGFGQNRVNFHRNPGRGTAGGGG